MIIKIGARLAISRMKQTLTDDNFFLIGGRSHLNIAYDAEFSVYYQYAIKLGLIYVFVELW